MSPESVHRSRHLVLGATVRTLGAWPSGWRYPGAHREPRRDPEILAHLAQTAEAAKFDFLFFGDWLATAPEFAVTDPYLLARIEPFAAIGYLSALTTRIGMIATVNSSYAEPYATARTTASLDLLSGGRVGVSIATGAELRSARNFGWEDIHPQEARVEAAAEMVELLRGLWDSWDDDAFPADAESGRLIDPEALHAVRFVGRHRASAGPLNVPRPPQGHLPFATAISSARSHEFAGRYADVAFASSPSFDDASTLYAVAKRAAIDAGRSPEDLLVLAPVLPIVAATREKAWAIYDALVESTPLADATSNAGIPLPTNRTMRSLAGILGVPLPGVLVHEVVAPRIAARFSDQGRALARTVFERSGRSVRGERQLTYRHLLVAHAIPAPLVVGAPTDIADHLESWFRGRAVDGFTVLSAFMTEQFDAFAELVVPELQRRGLFRSEYEGSTLRDHLGLGRPRSVFAQAEHVATRA